jgi:hypothetical protein
MKQFTFASRASQLVATLVAFAAVGSLSGVRSAQAGDVNTQTAEIHLLLTAVHQLTSYNGDAATREAHLATWTQLWAEDSTLSVNGGAPIEGRDAVIEFFANGALFNNNLVGLTPSFRKEIAIHGNTAEVYIECIFFNEQLQLAAARSLSGTIRKVNGEWRFWRMNNDPAQPLF